MSHSLILGQMEVVIEAEGLYLQFGEKTSSKTVFLFLFGMNISNIIHFMLFLRKKRKCAYSIYMLLLYKLIYIILAIFFECDSMEFLFYKFFKLKLRNDQSDFCQSFFQSKNFVIKIFSDSNFFYFSYRHVFKNP